MPHLWGGFMNPSSKSQLHQNPLRKAQIWMLAQQLVSAAWWYGDLWGSCSCAGRREGEGEISVDVIRCLWLSQHLLDPPLTGFSLQPHGVSTAFSPTLHTSKLWCGVQRLSSLPRITLQRQNSTQAIWLLDCVLVTMPLHMMLVTHQHSCSHHPG